MNSIPSPQPQPGDFGDSILPINPGRESFSSKLVIVAGAIAIAASMFLPWLRAEGAGQGDVYKGIDLLWMAVPVWIVCVVIAGSIFVRRPDIRSGLPMVGAGVVASICVVVVGAAEIVAAILPTSLVPEIFRKYVVNIGAGPGLWISLLSAALIFVAGSRYNWKQPLKMVAAQTDHIGKGGVRRALLCLLVSSLVLCWLRYQPWLEGNLAGKPVEVAGWDTPVSGPITFFGIVCLAFAGVLSFTSRIREATLFAAFGGWIFTFLAAAVIISGATWSLLPIDNYTVAELADMLSLEVPAGEVADSKVQLGAAWASWVSYLFGLITAASAIWVLSFETRLKGVAKPKGEEA